MTEQRNHYPVVLVPGVLGAGDEVKGSRMVPYFGTFSASVKETLKGLGMDSFTPTFGPLSGIWDRTCELYAQIAGGTVDYGAAHSKRFGTKRYGRTFKGFYPNWGTRDTDGNIRKLTLLAHGFGAPVARLLVSLMTDGSNEEKREGGQVSPLFQGGHRKWVHAVVTLAGVNDGTTFFQALDYRLPGTVKQLTKAGLVLNDLYSLLHYFSFSERASLSPHGGLSKFRVGEEKKPLKEMFSTDKENLNRYMNQTGDNIFYNLSLDGMAEFNKQMRIDPMTYYISITGEVTKDYGELLPEPKRNQFDMSMKPLKPRPEIILPEKSAKAAAPTAALICTFKNYLPDAPLVTDELLPNDGIVNTNTSLAPSTEPARGFSSTDRCVPGVWYQMPIEKNNHFDYIGLFQRPDEYRSYIANLFDVICNLETE